MLAATTTPHDNSGTTTPQDVLDLMLEVKIVDDEETFEATSSAVSTAASSLHAALSAETLRRRLSEDEGMEEPVNSAVRLARVTEERVEIQPASVAAKRSSTISVGAVESTAAAVALTPSVAELVVTNPVKPAVAELVSSTSEKHLEAIGTAFRSSIEPYMHTVMAFGALHPRVFTGRDAISVLVALVTQIVDGTAAEADGEISRTDAAAIAERLMTDHWTFAPLPEQTRKMKSVSPLVSVTCEETIESPTPSTKPRSSTGVSDLFDLVTSAAKTSVNPSTWSMFDDETTLYRLTRDTLLQRDFNASYFNDFLATVSDGEKGLEFREGKILFRRIGVEDRVFSQASWNRWFDQRLGMDQKQSSAVLKLFLERRAVEKVSMSSCYRFV